MSTSVRFHHRVEEELASYCVSRGLTKTQVLIAAVGEFLAKDGGAVVRKRVPAQDKASALYQAFAAGGLVAQAGADAPLHASAAKQRVRDVARARLAAKQAAV